MAPKHPTHYSYKCSSKSSTSGKGKKSTSYPSSSSSSSGPFASSSKEKPYVSPYPEVDDLGNELARMPSLSSSKSGSSPGSSSHRSAKSSKKLSSGASLRPADKEQMLRSLRTHRINTLTELRRIEKLMQDDTSKDTTEAMTTAWAHYVNSNNLLSELRGMTKNYPFSSECLDEAKWQVIGDPSSSRSWNYCWLILTKIKTESLIKKHARLQAAKPAMWGGKAPSSANVEKLANACVSEWNRAVDNMLKQWSTPPKVSK